MGFDLHTVEVKDGSTPPAMLDRLQVVMQIAVATEAGGGAGESVTTNISGFVLPPAYAVQVTPDQDAVAYVTDKTQTGFSVVLNPRLASNTLALGTIDIIVLA